jgi:hypothetical protein
MNQTAFNPASVAEVLPPVGRTVLVQCKGFRCLAYRDSAGKWRDAQRKNELSNVIKVIWDLGI